MSFQQSFTEVLDDLALLRRIVIPFLIVASLQFIATCPVVLLDAFIIGKGIYDYKYLVSITYDTI